MADIEAKVIELSKSPAECIDIYFKDTLIGIKKFMLRYKESQGSLDYFITRKILATMFNNLRELDTEFVSGELYEVYKDFKEMGGVYAQFQSRIAHPGIAYDNVFLGLQAGYKKVKRENEILDFEASNMSAKEGSLRNEIESKNAELKQSGISKSRYNEIISEIKHLKGQQVDLIHKTAVAKEQLEMNLKLMDSFKERYKGVFNELFEEQSHLYNAKAVSILNAQAYSFDTTLWKFAKKSKQIRKFFKNARIKGDFCSATYMKYYLGTLDRGKMTQEQVEMQKLFEYLKDKVGMCIIIVGADKEKLLDIKVTLDATTLDYRIEVFTDEAKSINFAKNHHVSLLILSEKLEKLTFEQYLLAYKKRVDDDIKCLAITDDILNIEVNEVLEINYVRSELIKKVTSLVN